jgi:hypothetical protein
MGWVVIDVSKFIPTPCLGPLICYVAYFKAPVIAWGSVEVSRMVLAIHTAWLQPVW